MIDDILKKLLAPSASTDYEAVKKILSGVPVDEFPLLIEKLVSEKGHAEKKHIGIIEYWSDQARGNSHSMEDYCDNEARASGRGEAGKQKEIDQIIDHVRSIQNERRR